MNNGIIWSFSSITILLSLGKSKTFLVETIDDQPGGHKGGVNGDDYSLPLLYEGADWEEQVPCEERKDTFLCPGDWICKKHTCINEAFGKPWEVRDIPCAERTGEFEVLNIQHVTTTTVLIKTAKPMTIVLGKLIVGMDFAPRVQQKMMTQHLLRNYIVMQKMPLLLWHQ
ncbi:uncharacterized protein LOC111713242 [Eurytemora carolleeae]|uniref:uncharacterized protein LOC111713242 n=1 Tax=Eurytemora carolleeae TaxID=1294199 RepID=UPI000C78569B|nr:uncharacterized protein LOC111713242 [Eurytemora carolleeae]XP_023343838.1 uncharacterized protein LOC111713242 [Eurytemora carolleeae]|eukprot:XP_023343837.1 uncharacterized protein LOC111713242 [Eurytemora affinis]